MNESSEKNGPVSENANGQTTLALLVQPGARRNAIVGVHDGKLKIAVTQVAEDGKANDAVIALLAKTWKIPKHCFEIVRGHTSREKRFVIHAMSVATLWDLVQRKEDSSSRQSSKAKDQAD